MRRTGVAPDAEPEDPMPETILVAVAWPYVNGPFHVGHLAGAYLPADIVARFERMRGNRVLMVSGSSSLWAVAAATRKIGASWRLPSRSCLEAMASSGA
jgi:hypothetical protein